MRGSSYSWYGTKMQVLDAEGYGRVVWQASANDGSPLSKYLIYKFDYGRDANNNYTLNRILLRNLLILQPEPCALLIQTGLMKFLSLHILKTMMSACLVGQIKEG